MYLSSTAALFSELYGDYLGWAEKNHEPVEPNRRFGQRLKDRGFEPDKGSRGIAIRRGIALRHDGGDDPDQDRSPREDAGDKANQSGDSPGALVNTQTPCKSAEKGGSVDGCGPKIDINSSNSFHESST